jgi:hypothetical protein
VTETGSIHLSEEEGFDGLGSEARKHDGIGDPGTDLLVDGQSDGLHQGRLTDEDEVVRGREILEEEAQPAQTIAGHEVGVVDDRDEEFAGTMDLKSLLNEETLAGVVVALELELEGLAEDTQGVVVGVKGAVDDGSNHALGVMGEEGLLEDRLARAGFAENETEAALLSVNTEDIKDLLLMGQEGDRLGVEGIARETEVRAEHRVLE